MPNEFEPDLVTVTDEDGKQHQFEILDAIETDEARYVALLPLYDEPEAAVEDSGELIILRVVTEGEDDFLIPIEDDEEFEEIAEIFEERLEDFYEIDEE